MYQGIFGAVLQEMKNAKMMPSNLKMDEAFVNAGPHHDVAVEVIKTTIDHLQAADRRFVWRVNTLKRKRIPSDP
jgi:hypothetical protein